jgi:hypothetical protein
MTAMWGRAGSTPPGKQRNDNVISLQALGIERTHGDDRRSTGMAKTTSRPCRGRTLSGSDCGNTTANASGLCGKCKGVPRAASASANGRADTMRQAGRDPLRPQPSAGVFERLRRRVAQPDGAGSLAETASECSGTVTDTRPLRGVTSYYETVRDATFAADMAGVHTHGTAFVNCDFRQARNLERARFSGSTYDRETRFPDGFDPATVGLRPADDRDRAAAEAERRLRELFATPATGQPAPRPLRRHLRRHRPPAATPEVESDVTTELAALRGGE